MLFVTGMVCLIQDCMKPNLIDGIFKLIIIIIFFLGKSYLIYDLWYLIFNTYTDYKKPGEGLEVGI